jgi:signal transduction histidine kinase
MVNLISNAIRHGGPMIGVEVTAGDGVVDIEVWDNGPGVPPDQEARLFQRFVHEGSEPLLAGSIGLGLAVASRLVSLMGGRLKYQRFAPKTYFVVSLPLGDRSEDTDSEEAEPVGSVTAKIRELAG